jgi:glutamyl-tRNA synthetase
MDDGELLRELIAFLPHAEGGAELLGKLDDTKRAQLKKAMAGLKERARTLVELKTGAAFLFASMPLQLDGKAELLLDEKGRTANAASLSVLSNVSNWVAADLEIALKEYVKNHNLKLGELAQPLRAALTGSSTSPPIFDVMEVLGREESLARIEDKAN